ncbi:MAG: hypothetical protein JNL74_24595 [Fibrobacteres bacterium]|nr:hypothetical protein [Fibrobacterota bacterium]
MLKKLTLILTITATIIIAQTPEPFPAVDAPPTQQEPMAVDPQPVEPQPPTLETAPAVPVVDSAKAADEEKAETDKPGSKSKIVITPKRENQTEVIKTYSGEVNILKSPKKAFFLSLLVPGLGEYYAGASVPRVAIPAAIEVTTWVTSTLFKMKYEEKTKEYQDFADEHFSNERLQKWYNYLVTAPSSKIVFRPTAHDDSALKSGVNEKSNDFYEMIGKYNAFSQGWDDVNPELNETYYNRQNGGYFSLLADTQKYWSAFALDTVGVPYVVEGGRTITNLNYVHPAEGGSPYYYGKSKRQLLYMDLRDDANEMGDIYRGILFTLIVNRIASSIDALLAATSYNTKITGGSLSRLQRIHLEPIQVGNTAMPANGVSASYKF